MMQNSVAVDGLSATGFCTAHGIDLVSAIFRRTDVRLRNTPCLGRFERYRLTGPDSGQPDVTQEPGIPLFITQAQKRALRERGFADEEIRNMTPIEAHKLLG